MLHRKLLIALGAWLVFAPTVQAANSFETSFTPVQGWTTDREQYDANGGFNGVQTGVGNYGGWTTANGSKDIITTAANNPLGGTGRGFRHWRGDGTNNNGGAVNIGFPATREFWMRFYMRYMPGFNWRMVGQPHYTKDIYVNVGQSVGNFVLGFSGTNSWGLAMVSPSSTNLRAPPGWQTINGGLYGDGQFHCYEAHVKWDTNGADGVAESWVDGVQNHSVSNHNFGTTGSWSFFAMGENQNEVDNDRDGLGVGDETGAPDGYTDYDDVAVSISGRVGCLGSPPPPPSGSACDLNGDNTSNVSDVQLCVNQAIGSVSCGSGDINKDNQCNVVDVQRVVNAALGGQCVTQ